MKQTTWGNLSFESYVDEKGILGYGLYFSWKEKDGSWTKINLIDELRSVLVPEFEHYENGFNLEEYGPYKLTIEKLAGVV